MGTHQPFLHQSYENCPLVKLNNLDFLVPRLKTYFHLDLQAFIEEKEIIRFIYIKHLLVDHVY